MHTGDTDADDVDRDTRTLQEDRGRPGLGFAPSLPTGLSRPLPLSGPPEHAQHRVLWASGSGLSAEGPLLSGSGLGVTVRLPARRANCFPEAPGS